MTSKLLMALLPPLAFLFASTALARQLVQHLAAFRAPLGLLVLDSCDPTTWGGRPPFELTLAPDRAPRLPRCNEPAGGDGGASRLDRLGPREDLELLLLASAYLARALSFGPGPHSPVAAMCSAARSITPRVMPSRSCFRRAIPISPFLYCASSGSPGSTSSWC